MHGVCKCTYVREVFGSTFTGTMDINELKKTFSYVEPCIRKWESSRALRSRGIKGISLLQGSDDPMGENVAFVPSLANISRNFSVLKAFTGHMASTGVICTKHVVPIREAVVAFYDLMEVDVKSPEGISTCHELSKSIKKMLGTVRRKWGLCEMPRVPRLMKSSVD